MIGLGSQYLTAAGFGRYRITAASLGNLDLLGTLGWLMPATKQAILGAFGDDGKAVINATNEYLNGIAASDRDKATALADVLNANAQNAVMAKYVADYGDSFAHMVLDLGMTTFIQPRIASLATSNSERMWLVRSGQQYTDWTDLDNIMSHDDWQYVLGDLSSGNVGSSTYCSLCGTKMTAPRTLVAFFVPTAMPTGFNHWFADGIIVNVNGTEIFSSGSYHNNMATVNYDFTNIIELNKPNYVVIAWRGGGSHGCGFGFVPSTP